MFEWSYDGKYVDVSVPIYVLRALTKYQHPTPKHPVYVPHKWNGTAYSTKTQYAPEPDMLQRLNADEKRHVQLVVGTFLFYRRAVEPTILPTLNKLGTQQSAQTEQTT
eukprot:7668857-Ditylum_brightwellii.AAC.1